MADQSSIETARLARLSQIAAQRYVITWRGNSESEQLTLEELCAKLRLTKHSVRCYLARGSGSFTARGTNPLTNELDAFTVTRIAPAKEKRPRGRPPKLIDWERLGSEAPYNPSGTSLTPPAKTVPKTRNRRTGEKP